MKKILISMSVLGLLSASTSFAVVGSEDTTQRCERCEAAKQAKQSLDAKRVEQKSSAASIGDNDFKKAEQGAADAPVPGPGPAKR
jgi:hypothetical protein